MGSGSCAVPVAASPLGKTSTQAVPIERGEQGSTQEIDALIITRRPHWVGSSIILLIFLFDGSENYTMGLPLEREKFPSLILEHNFRV